MAPGLPPVFASTKLTKSQPVASFTLGFRLGRLYGPMTSQLTLVHVIAHTNSPLICIPASRKRPSSIDAGWPSSHMVWACGREHESRAFAAESDGAKIPGGSSWVPVPGYTTGVDTIPVAMALFALGDAAALFALGDAAAVDDAGASICAPR